MPLKFTRSQRPGKTKVGNGCNNKHGTSMIFGSKESAAHVCDWESKIGNEGADRSKGDAGKMQFCGCYDVRVRQRRENPKWLQVSELVGRLLFIKYRQAIFGWGGCKTVRKISSGAQKRDGNVCIFCQSHRTGTMARECNVSWREHWAEDTAQKNGGECRNQRWEAVGIRP